MINFTPGNVRMWSILGSAGTFGIAAMDLPEIDDSTLVLTADLRNFSGLDRFAATFPDRLINVGIAEQNLVGMAAGFASEGHPVVASAQAAFISMRSFEQVRQYLGYMKLPIVTVGVSAGFGLTFFGNTHYAIEDIAVMRTIPGLTILSPSERSSRICSLPSV